MAAVLCIAGTAPGWSNPDRWKSEWPDTDFSRQAVDYAEIMSGGPPKDGIPPIDEPTFVPIDADTALSLQEPVIGLIVNGDARAYPLRILIWHEIVNDTVGGVPVAVTYCPLCNAAIVFDRRVGGRVLDFGTTGKLRHSDLVMYDRQTESWWQQFSGEAIVGDMLGERLALVPARLESVERFKARTSKGQVLVPTDPDSRRYGMTPYAGYDTSAWPFLYRGEGPPGIGPLDRVVRAGDYAWSLQYLREAGRLETDDGVVVTWTPGQNSAMDAAEIGSGRDVGNVVVQRRTADGAMVDVQYSVDFAFAVFAFRPDLKIVVQ
tara:strand:+ start:162 stop:1121 length:960 start_codon:yes stop_codon:yes gene_type:complete